MVSKHGSGIRSTYNRAGRQYGDGTRVTPKRRTAKEARMSALTASGTVEGLPPAPGQRAGFYAANLPGSSRAHAPTEAERQADRVKVARMAASINAPLRTGASRAEKRAYVAQMRADVLGPGESAKRAAKSRVASAKKR